MQEREAIIPEEGALPLVYACSGCSGAAQLANGIAVRLDRDGLAEMSCIAGVGGDVPAILKLARSGRPIVVLDGCRLHCARNCLRRHAIAATLHIDLSCEGVRKRMHGEVPEDEAQRVWASVVLPRLNKMEHDGCQGCSDYAQAIVAGEIR